MQDPLLPRDLACNSYYFQQATLTNILNFYRTKNSYNQKGGLKAIIMQTIMMINN